MLPGWALRLFLGIVLAAYALLLTLACAPADRLQILRRHQPPAQVPGELSTLWEVWQLLDNEYGGKEAIAQQGLAQGAIQGMLSALGENGSQYLTPQDYNVERPDLDGVWQAWKVLTQRLKEANVQVPPQKMEEAAIHGMLAALGNPYTMYLLPEEYDLEARGLESSFEGIGVYVNFRSNQLTVIAPVPGSPADRAGVLAGDIILEVGGAPTEGLSLGEAAQRIRGPKGTTIQLKVLHPGQGEAQTITVARDVVKQQSVFWEPLGEGVAYLRVTQFLDDTDKEVEKALGELLAQGAEGLILDLRRNPGGLLESAVTITSQFLQDGLVLYQVSSHDRRVDNRVKEGGIALEIPMVVLTDLASASASEVVAGALQDHQRAMVIGTRTFGKGSVNQLRRLGAGSGLYLTSSLWYTPEGRMIEGVGLTPDIQVPMDLRIPLGSSMDWQLYTGVNYLLTRRPVAVK